MVTERRWGTIGLANSTLSRKYENLFFSPGGSLPAHANILHPAEKVAARPLREIISRDREFTVGAIGTGHDFVDPLLPGF